MSDRTEFHQDFALTIEVTTQNVRENFPALFSALATRGTINASSLSAALMSEQCKLFGAAQVISARDMVHHIQSLAYGEWQNAKTTVTPEFMVVLSSFLDLSIAESYGSFAAWIGKLLQPQSHNFLGHFISLNREGAVEALISILRQAPVQTLHTRKEPPPFARDTKRKKRGVVGIASSSHT